MERGNFSAAAGFGQAEGKQGVFSTFAAFLEMCLSEITMARLNKCNVLSHFSHSGVDDMADLGVTPEQAMAGAKKGAAVAQSLGVTPQQALKFGISGMKVPSQPRDPLG